MRRPSAARSCGRRARPRCAALPLPLPNPIPNLHPQLPLPLPLPLTLSLTTNPTPTPAQVHLLVKFAMRLDAPVTVLNVDNEQVLINSTHVTFSGIGRQKPKKYVMNV